MPWFISNPVSNALGTQRPAGNSHSKHTQLSTVNKCSHTRAAHEAAQHTHRCMLTSMQLRLCTNYRWIHKLGVLHTEYSQMHTQRCDLPGKATAMWENTSQSKQSLTRQPLVPRPEPRAALLTSLWEERKEAREERGEQVIRWDQTRHEKKAWKACWGREK